MATHEGEQDIGNDQIDEDLPVYLIKIIKRPEGTAPAKIRDAWVGELLIATQPPGLMELDHENAVLIIGRKPFLVMKNQAVELLYSHGKADAAHYFEESFPFESMTFGAHEVEVVAEIDLNS